MGSYCALKFDEIDVHNSKSYVPETFISLFQETDRRTQEIVDAPDEPQLSVTYVAARDIILERLDVLGITAEAVQEAFSEWIREETEFLREFDGGDSAALEKFDRLTYTEWLALAADLLRTRYDFVGGGSEAARQKEWILFSPNDDRLLIRALLEACDDAREVILDISDLIGGGWLKEDVRLCDEARAPGAMERPLLEPTVILGEGSSDIRILRQSLEVLFPHLVDYFAFFDHNELSVDGGVGYLIKFLQAFAAARISSRMIAIFDNDTAGREAFSRASAMPLPPNIKVLHLPDLEFAKSYPSIGPQGEHLVDINGTAAGIELYLGLQNLKTSQGALTPIRWRGYSDKMGSYQGELEGKAGIVKRFEQDLKQTRTPQEAQQAFPELAAIWQTIFAALRPEH